MRRSGLVSALLLLATVVYVELRLPESAFAQGLDAVYRRLSVVVDVRLPANSIQEAEIDIDNAPTDDFVLTWDDQAGKPTWRTIGFDSSDWSGFTFPTTFIPPVCPTVAGGSLITDRGYLMSWLRPILSAILVTDRKSYLNYDYTFYRPGPVANASNYIFIQTSFKGVNTIHAVGQGPGRTTTRVTGKTDSLAVGPTAVVMGKEQQQNIYFCPLVSSFWMTAT